jgi:hypothetical protein
MKGRNPEQARTGEREAKLDKGWLAIALKRLAMARRGTLVCGERCGGHLRRVRAAKEKTAKNERAQDQKDE